MYLLYEREWFEYLKEWRPQGLRANVTDQLRGWNWEKGPLRPARKLTLGLPDIAGKNCPTGRDFYLRRVQGVDVPEDDTGREKLIYRQGFRIFVDRARTLIKRYGCYHLPQILEELAAPVYPAISEHNLPPGIEEQVRRNLGHIWRFEFNRVAKRLQCCLSWYAHLGEESLLALTLPVKVDEHLDGSPFGIEPAVQADSYHFSEPVAVTMRFDSRRHFHRLLTTGQALLREALYGEPVNLGCVVYVRFRAGQVLVRRDYHIITDEMRRWFIQERDTKMDILASGRDPGRGRVCSTSCQYQDCCSRNPVGSGITKGKRLTSPI